MFQFTLLIQKVKITEFDTQLFKIKAEGYDSLFMLLMTIAYDHRFGETFDLSKHPQVYIINNYVVTAP